MIPQMNTTETAAAWMVPLSLAVIFWILPARAEIIAQYEFTGPAPLISSDTSLNSTAEDISINFPHSASTTGTAGGTAYAFADVVDGISGDPGDEAGAVALGHYFSFTVEPVAGYQIDLTSLSFDILFDATPGADPTPEATWFVKTSVGGFGAGDPTVGARNAPVSTVDTAFETIDPVMDLSGLPTLTSSTEFRLYLYDNQVSSSLPHRLDNVVLNGGVSVIPEPATFWMLALGLSVVAAYKRRGLSR